jgi:putative hydrolase of the HAD superfamily
MIKVQAVIFDLFGTLVDGFAASSAGYHEEFSAALGVDHASFMQHWRQITDRRTMGDFQSVEASILHVCDRMGVSVTTEQMAKAVKIRLELTRRALAPRSDAVSTITQLKCAGFKIGLLSNCSIEIPLVWPETPFAGLIDSAVFSSRERLKKPDPRIYHVVCDRLGVMPATCLYIADGENYELAGAADVGMLAVLIRNAGPDDAKEILREARDWRGAAVSGLSEVLSLAGIGNN